MTKEFKEIYPDFVKLCDKSPRFKAMLNRQLNQVDGKKTKHLNKGKDSIRIRFAVMICFQELIKERKKLQAEVSSNENNLR